ncbi:MULTISPECIES: type I 3-dehydroquinate dehydratase [Aerococcus]|uniref:3-dehydroquinate dehydratase n=1 Tax=Aerococcus mictus TaxID=2976810 RepID=A0A9Q4H415_9LACT|nr:MULTISPECIES: type I 3-dehydroquinate dehydratase [Aerococcus]MCY3031472.1 type I 3-dehydroquinate dehydratase [Aerococcus sp. Group 1]MCY3039776.1 type I 3-dehydroquinate dehydratase [Aerococcus sp. Group 2]MCY3041584.1 type I 3-dehydroquinate dehydratase [Aerococcus sp. Group 2]MCY3043197.1 type I 3-dehydroquinate dehydratase [Aerococcus sp. Group 2]MCY3066236.1 type I 3-dehydroquinate dehydratase [Aerococcus mictus]
MKEVVVKDVTIGKGRPKVIIPVVANSEKAIIDTFSKINQEPCDLIEWRIDHFDDVLEEGAVAALSHKLKGACPKPLLITFRTQHEGGACQLDDEGYQKLYQTIIAEADFELLDIEMMMPEDMVTTLIDRAHQKGIKVILSNHDFDKTPKKETIIDRLSRMEEKGADIAKIAVMPNENADVVTLLNATFERYQVAETPLITMSMGQLGMVSRLAGELFGSQASFGALGQVSAPGQAPVEDLHNILNLLTLNAE